MSVGRCFLIVGLVFGVGLAAVVGSRMSAEAMAVVVGIVCGVAAGIPTSVLLLLVMARRDRSNHEGKARSAHHGGNPPVVVIQGGAPQALTPGPQAGYWPALMPGMPPSHREFHVVGDEALHGEEWR